MEELVEEMGKHIDALREELGETEGGAEEETDNGEPKAHASEDNTVQNLVIASLVSALVFGIGFAFIKLRRQ
jgi:hypothetical protein